MTKKTVLSIIIASLLLPMIAGAQDKFELTPSIGYFFGGRIDFIQGDLNIRDEVSWGITAGKPVRPDMVVEFSYTGMNSVAHWSPYFGYGNEFPEKEFDVVVNYFNIGATQGSEIAPRLHGFGGVYLGAAWFNAQSGIEDIWRFNITLGAGLKYYFTDKLGLRLQGNIRFPMFFSGGGFYCGIGSGGSGCGLSIGSTSSIIEGDLTAGLIFKLGK